MWEILTGSRKKNVSQPGESVESETPASPLRERKAQFRSLGTNSIAFKDLEISATIDEHEPNDSSEGVAMQDEDASAAQASERISRAPESCSEDQSLSQRSSINLSDAGSSPSPRGRVPNTASRLSWRPQKWKVVKHVLIMVGLPGRGKTFLCNKLKCYLNWLGHNTKHINVGQFRRKQKDDQEPMQSAGFFDNANPEGVERRERALEAALGEVHEYLATETGQVIG